MTDLTSGPVVRDRLYIGGEWVSPDSSELVDVRSASTEEVVARVAAPGPGDIDRAVAAARAAFDAGPWPRLAPTERAEVLGRLTAAIGERANDFADAAAHEIGSPRKWAKYGQVAIATPSSTSTGRSPDVLVARRAHRSDGQPGQGAPPTGRRGRRHRAVERARSFTAALKLGPALVAGCTVVLKPAPESALAPCSSATLPRPPDSHRAC